jgi:hypothetical protein
MGQFWAWIMGTLAAAIALYCGAAAHRRRQGADSAYGYNEIPPE